MRSVAERFQLIQLGVSFFVLEPTTIPGETRYTAYPYNIYLFPEEKPGSRSDVVFDVDTVNFHKQQKLDFNKWIYEGVPYLSERVEKMLLSRAIEERPEDTEAVRLSEEDAKKIALILESIKKWIQDGAKSEFVISDLNPFLRKSMYQKIKELFPALYVESKLIGKFEKNIVLKMMTEEEKKAIKEAKRQEELKEIHRKTGARRLFKLLSSIKAPIIGHNPTFDFMFIYSHLQDELPHSLAEFKSQINSLFPNIYDTMIVFADEKVKKLLPEKQSSALEAVYLFLSKSTEMSNVAVSIGVPNNKYSDTGHYHEAGYDSYITGIFSSSTHLGYCFAKMLNYIKKEDLEKYKNQLYSHRTPYNINLTGKEELHDNVQQYGEITNRL